MERPLHIPEPIDIYKLCDHIRELNQYIDYLESNKKVKRMAKSAIPPTLPQAIEFFRSYGFPESHAKFVFDYYQVADWHDSKGNPVRNWRQKFKGNWMDEKFKDKNSPSLINKAVSQFDRLKQ